MLEARIKIYVGGPVRPFILVARLPVVVWMSDVSLLRTMKMYLYSRLKRNGFCRPIHPLLTSLT